MMEATDESKPAAPPNSENTSQPMLQSLEPDEDPLLIAQTLTYVTDDGSVVLSFQSAPFSLGMYRYSIIALGERFATCFSRRKIHDSFFFDFLLQGSKFVSSSWK